RPSRLGRAPRTTKRHRRGVVDPRVLRCPEVTRAASVRRSHSSCVSSHGRTCQGGWPSCVQQHSGLCRASSREGCRNSDPAARTEQPTNRTSLSVELGRSPGSAGGFVLVSFCYVLLRWLLEFVTLRARADAFKDLEIIVLRHELAILRRTSRRLRP